MADARANAVVFATAQRFGLRVEDLTGPSRKAEIARARHLAMWLIQSETGATLKSIGRIFGGRDHSTVIHAIDIAKRRLSMWPKGWQDVLEIKACAARLEAQIGA